ncbi:MAG: efflux RND transporter periplasmic adaptor subunit [Cyclobacteriaceae bacterium]|nr:efflux RND transporter periplasmic adaptor subunit [Cyclobacteriaceae bacterium]
MHRPFLYFILHQTLAYPDKIFEGKIANVSSVIDVQSKVLKIRVELLNEGGLLKPDMFATIRVHLPNGGTHLAVSPKSIVFDHDAYYVVTFSKGDYKIVPVIIMKNTSTKVFVEGGVKPGDIIVTEGSLLMFNELSD